VKQIGGDSPSPFYSKLKIHNLHDLYRMEVAKFVHKTTAFLVRFQITSLNPIKYPTAQRELVILISTFRDTERIYLIGASNVKELKCGNLPKNLFSSRLKQYYLQFYDS